MTQREQLLALAREISDALQRAYQPKVIEAMRSRDPRALEIIRLRFETDYRRQTNHIVRQLASIPPEPPEPSK